MTVTTRVWIPPEPLAGDGWRGLHDDLLVADLLWRRGLREPAAAADFLDASPGSAAEFLRVARGLPNFAAAVDRGVCAIRSGERIAIFGDYDADGTTAAAILTLFLRGAIGTGQVMTCLPDREAGYGLADKDVARLADHGSLLVVVDTGSNDERHVAQARARGVDVVILDHHQLPDGFDGPGGAITVSAYLEPTREPRDPLRDLTGAGLAWLYVLALADAMSEPRLKFLADGLQDLAMLGTVADVADLRGLNRRLVRDGLRVVRTRPHPGVVALCGAARVEPRTLTALDATMKLAPRLNAAGRMGDPMVALDLLVAPDIDRATPYARKLEALNVDRKRAMDRVIREAEAVLTATIGQAGGLSSDILVAHGPDWSPGVIGPAASRIVDQFNKPAILICDDASEPGMVRGSARSIPGFDIAKALRHPACAALLTRSGGHSAAAGITLPAANIVALAEALEDLIDRAVRADSCMALGAPRLDLEAELPASRLTLATAEAISQLGPFGQGNPNPLFLVRRVPLQGRTLIGKDPGRQHLKLIVGPPGQLPAEVIVWGASDRFAEAATARTVDLAVRIGINRWNGRRKLEAIAEDFRLAR